MTEERFMIASDRVRHLLRDAGKQPLYLTISGSHACGLERPDSDIDVRGVYLDETSSILSIRRGPDTIEGKIEGPPEIDYQCYELEKFLGMLLSHNGNCLRLLLSPLTCYAAPVMDWENLGRRFLTKRLREYYRGYAQSQRKRAMSQRGGKALIYTYREIFEGISVMERGFPILDFKESWAYVRERGYYKTGLLDHYFERPQEQITDEGWRQFYAEWDELCRVLDTVTERSSLPGTYDGYAYLNQFLLRMRIENLGQKSGKD